jgi:AcrR family transcriptional regulator
MKLEQLKAKHIEAHHPTRMKAEDRRELILVAATTIFGAYGYFGSTTDQVARAANVSQPYVVRMFGTKEKLYIEVLGRALDKVFTAFRSALAEGGDVPVMRRMGLAYIALLGEEGLLLCLSHCFLLGNEPTIGAFAREGFLSVYTFLREEAGFTPAECQEFLAAGMLSNTMIGLRMTDLFSDEAQARELLTECFPGKLEVVLSLAEAHRPGPK